MYVTFFCHEVEIFFIVPGKLCDGKETGSHVRNIQYIVVVI